jgi:hypothetical protein
VACWPQFLGTRHAPGPFSTLSFSVTFYSLRDQCSYYGMVKFRGKEGFSPFKPLNSSPSASLLFQNSYSSSPVPWDPINALSTATATRKIPLLNEASPTKVMSCALITSTDLQKDLDAAKEVTGGAGAPSAKMAGRPANSPGWTAMVCGQSVTRDEG